MKKDFYRNIGIVAIFAIVFIILLSNPPADRNEKAISTEIQKIKTLTSIDEQGVELKKLLERVGPEEAQEQMLRSGLPFTGQTHLLVHVVGDYVYDRYGLNGLPYCRDYFLSACYHGFILNTLGDHGMQGLADTMANCNQAAPGVSAQCAHGAGHGFVAWHDYDLLKALEMCDELGSKTEGFGHFNCYDGVFMENFWGVHDGLPSPKRWVKEGDINYPCNDPRIPEKYLKGCWANQATLIFQHYKGDLAKTSTACEAVANTDHQNACYNNLFRQIHPLTRGQKEKVVALCSVNPSQERRDECLLTNMMSYWSVGDRQVPYEICDMTSGGLREECFRTLVGMIDFHYQALPKERAMYCAKISSETHKQACLN